jgi:hypothetical protein
MVSECTDRDREQALHTAWLKVNPQRSQLLRYGYKACRCTAHHPGTDKMRRNGGHDTTVLTAGWSCTP